MHKYEQELTKAASLLQATLAIGEVKHIGLLEVSAGIQELVQRREETVTAHTHLQQKYQQLRNLYRELDEELDGVRLPASAAAVCNSLRDFLSK